MAIAGPRYLRGWSPRTALEGPRGDQVGLEYWTWDFGEADHDHLYLRLWEHLCDLHALAPLTHVFYEASGGNFKSEAAVWIQIGMAAVVRLWCKLHAVTAEKVNNTKVKLHAALSGRAEKSEMIGAAQRLGWDPDTADCADALFVLDYKLSEWHRS